MGLTSTPNHLPVYDITGKKCFILNETRLSARNTCQENALKKQAFENLKRSSAVYDAGVFF